VLGSHGFLDRQTELSAATLCRNVSLGLGAIVRVGAVLGDGCRIGPKSIIQPEIRLPPGTVTERHAVVHHSAISGGRKSGGLFGYAGVRGVCHTEMTTGFVNDLALAFGSVLPVGSTVAVGFDASPYCSLLAVAFSAGLQATGVHTRHIGTAISSVCRYITAHFGCAGGIFIRKDDGDEEACLIEFLDEQGVRISKAAERKIENTFALEDYRRAPSGKLGQRFVHSGAVPLYRAKLLELVPVEDIRKGDYTAVVQYDQSGPNGLVPELLRELGCRVILLENGKFSREDVSRLVRINEADFGVIMDANAQRIELATERGDFVREEALALLQCLMQIHCEDKPALRLPVYLPDLAEQLALRNGRQPEWTKADMRSVMQGGDFNGFHVYFDGLYTLVRLMQLMTLQGKRASQLLADIPEFTLLTRRVECPWSEKGKVMRFLMEETKGYRVELIDGIKVYHDHGWTLILPDSDEPSFRIYSNSGDARQAEEQVLFYTKKITERHRTGNNDLQVL
jgi:mannose-1-phosphate guanylyltransferase/phosphomannomutase